MIQPKILGTALLFTALTALVVPLSTAAESTKSQAQGAVEAGTPVVPDHEAWASLTPEQKDARRAELRAKWDNLTPEEKAAHKQEFQQKWASMSDEQKAEIRKKFLERRDGAAQ